ncbi:MAG: Plug domain-containing protein [Ignavibacteriota bacterium]
MQVGSLTDAVEVSAAQSNSRRRAPSAVLPWSVPQIENIAVNSRSYLDLVKLVPGVVSTVNLTTAGTGGPQNIAANGNRYNSNNVTLNGLSNIDSGSNGNVNASISLDSVQEYKILTGVYQAEYGRSMGAQISVLTKSGSSEFHGSAYWFHRHDDLNANTWINNRQPIGGGGNPRALFRFNDLGYTIGGPILLPKLKTKDKLFFFWSEEFQRQLKPTPPRM